MSTKYFRDASNNYLGATSGEVMVGGIEVGLAPEDARMVFVDGAWVLPDLVVAEVSKERDLDAIRLAATKDTALILVELITKLLADNVISGADFSPSVRQSYQDLKVLADKIANND